MNISVVQIGNSSFPEEAGGSNNSDSHLRIGSLTPKSTENSINLGVLSLPEAWGWAFLFVTIINLSSVMGIIFFPLMKKSFYTLVMRTMIGLAIGSLSGSALFHLIPAAFDLEAANEKGQNYINIALFVWLSMWMVMILECTIKIIVKMKSRKSSKSLDNEYAPVKVGNNNHHTQLPLRQRQRQQNPNTMADMASDENPPNANGGVHLPKLGVEEYELEPEVDSDADDFEEESNPTTNALTLSNGNLPVYHSTFSLNNRALDLDLEEKQPQEIKTVAWLIIIGDSLHNFIDGVSIGAAFVKDFRTGAVISLAIMCEEFPHELGDFAILINSGFSVKKALVVNFLSALTCYLGMALGILLGEIEWANFIFAFAAGIFLYVSLADMIPEITSLIEEVSEISPRNAWIVLFTHNIGILVGISILYLLAALQIQ